MLHLLLLVLLVICNYGLSETSQPNIIFVTVDDWGYSDLSVRGGEFETPNLDTLYKNSIVLKNHYIGISLDFPSRAQFLTGRYAWNMGLSKMQEFSSSTSLGIPPALPTIGNLLKEYGNYKTYFTGKWHVGHETTYHTPLQRGFDEFYGSLSNEFDYTPSIEKDNSNSQIDSDTIGTSNTFTTENKMKYILNQHINEDENDNNPFFIYAVFQSLHKNSKFVGSGSADEYCNQKQFLNDNERYLYCINVASLDQTIGNIIQHLKDNQLWDDTIIVMTSDSGADYQSGGCNYPLNGGKWTYFEGGSKTIAFVGGGYIPEEQRGTQRMSYFHGSDWVPTLLSMANIDVIQVNNELQTKLYNKIGDKLDTNQMIDSFDGIDLSQLLLYGTQESQRTNVPLAISTINTIDKNSQTTTTDDNSIVFRSSITNNVYKFMYFDAPLGSHSKTNTEKCLFQTVALKDSNGDATIVRQRRSESTDFDTTKLLFDLTLDLHESENLMQYIDMNSQTNGKRNRRRRNRRRVDKEDDMNYFNQIGKVSDYQNKDDLIEALWNEAINIIKKEYIENNPLFHDFLECATKSNDYQSNQMESSNSFVEWDDYVNEFTQSCSNVNDESSDSSVSDINSVLLELYTTKYDDYINFDDISYSQKETFMAQARNFVNTVPKSLPSVVMLCGLVITTIAIIAIIAVSPIKRTEKKPIDTKMNNLSSLDSFNTAYGAIQVSIK